MIEKYAIIDLGSNTFHLLIASVDENLKVHIHFKERVYVKLAQEGVGKIGNTPFRRGIETLKKFRFLLDEYGVKRYRALGTATLRKASNAPDFLKEALETAEIDIEIIQGEEEAKLIYKGVLAANGEISDKAMIMDIGGGSVEFIVYSKDQIHWYESFPVGVAVLKNKFQNTGPMTPDILNSINDWLNEKLHTLRLALDRHQPTLLIGASGTFEVLDEAMGIPSSNENFRNIDFSNFHNICNQILQANEQEIQDLEWIPAERKDLIQVAFALLLWVIKESNIKEIAISQYAMKEGAIFQIATS